jgi:hypothetical protein
MEYRAGLAGAAVQVRRSKTGGTLVACTLPAEEHAGQTQN